MIDWQYIQMSVYLYDCKGEILRLERKGILNDIELEEMADQVFAELFQWA